MDKTVLKQKINTLEKFPELNASLVKKFGEIIERLAGWDLYRINPITFAKENQLPEFDTINMFICGAKIGIFNFEWNLICPMCGSIMKSHKSLGNVEKDKIHCSVCDIDIEVDLSQFVEVAFSIDESIENKMLDPFKDYFNDYRKYFFSKNFTPSKKLADYMSNIGIKGFYPIASDDTVKINFKAKPNELYRLSNPDNNFLVKFVFNDQISSIPEIIDIDLLSNGFSTKVYEIPAGDITIQVKSHLPTKAGLQLLFVDYPFFTSITPVDFPTFQPYITGKMLLNNQIFRDLFRIQSLPKDLKLKVSNITILFTDLKGSTELYEKTGDMNAYNIVQDHFEVLKDSTKKYSGAIIKTIGDAIMAAFSRPSDGIMAALDMIDKIEEYNKNNTSDPISIKVGLNIGNALTVTANDMLDYFGQSVNIAARVQGLAGSQEIWFTENIYNDEISSILNSSKFNIEKKSALLKGIAEPTIVYKTYKV